MITTHVRSPPRLPLAAALLVVCCWCAAGFAQTAAAEPLTAEVDWFQELGKGGNTGIALFVLAFVTVTIALERLLNLRASRIVPPGFSRQVLPLWQSGNFDDIVRYCKQHPSTLSRMTSFLVEHRKAPAELLIQGAADIGDRELLHEQKRAYGLAAIAGLAPLLGLLGTIIGMIESFKLVEMYGDEGGATVLAGSISKALITTALGLIIAIPALALYHGFKYKTQSLGKTLDEQMECLINEWLLKTMLVSGPQEAGGPAGSAAEPAAISFLCSSCRQKLKADADMSGMAISCPRCGERLTVPSASKD